MHCFNSVLNNILLFLLFSECKWKIKGSHPSILTILSSSLAKYHIYSHLSLGWLSSPITAEISVMATHESYFVGKNNVCKVDEILNRWCYSRKFSLYRKQRLTHSNHTCHAERSLVSIDPIWYVEDAYYRLYFCTERQTFKWSLKIMDPPYM